MLFSKFEDLILLPLSKNANVEKKEPVKLFNLIKQLAYTFFMQKITINHVFKKPEI